MNVKSKKLLYINERPYFLLNNYTVESTIDLENKILNTEHKKNVLFCKIHWLEIFFIKFFPYIFLLFLMYRFPQNRYEIFISILSILGIYLFKIISKYFSTFFIKFISILFVVLCVSVVLKIEGSFKYVNFFIISIVSNFILFLLIEEYLKHGLMNYYKLLNIAKKGSIKITRQKEVKGLKIPFMKKYVFRQKIGFDSSIKYNLDGFYFKIIEEELENV